ncbi:MAG: serine hydrolase [Candidatus Aminicenantes bacterium]|nr:serine hydrolase [Candidatus Aminicenantes bacterium]
MGKICSQDFIKINSAFHHLFLRLSRRIDWRHLVCNKGFIFFYLFLIAFFILIAQPLPKEIALKATDYFRIQSELGRFSGAVLIGYKGKIIFEKGFGLANYELNVPIASRTKFRLGSLTKSFTATAILQLAERGLLNLNDLVSKYLPDYPQGDKITIHHLLTHASGIPNFTALPAYPKFKLNPTTLNRTIGLFRQLPLEFEPGTKFRYSNSNYILLTAIIEKVSGQNYADYLRENIFLPLNMLETGYDDPNSIIKYRARGYSLKDGEVINAPYIDMTVPAGAGGLLSTVGDLFAWDQGLRSDQILKAASREKMFTPYLENYGYGWVIKKINGRLVAQHSGSIEGFVSQMIRFLDDDLCLIILSNFDFAPIGQFTNDMLSLLFGKPINWPKERKAISISAEIFNRYCGEYEVAPNITIKIFQEKSRFWSQVSGQPKMEILPESETKFFVRLIEAEITFILDSEGKTTALVLNQGGKDHLAKKIR